MKKEYIKPQMEVMKIKAVQILAGSPNPHDVVGGGGQFAPVFDDPAWDFLDETP
jgi:hypothetical protein